MADEKDNQPKESQSPPTPPEPRYIKEYSNKEVPDPKDKPKPTK